MFILYKFIQAIIISFVVWFFSFFALLGAQAQLQINPLAGSLLIAFACFIFCMIYALEDWRK